MVANREHPMAIAAPAISAASITATILMRASPIRPDMESAHSHANRCLQKAQLGLHDLEMRQVLSAAYIRELEDRPSNEQYAAEVAARKNAEARADAVNVENSKLLRMIEDQTGSIVELQNKLSKAIESLETLRDEQKTVARVLQDESHRVVELEAVCESLSNDAAVLSDENTELRQEVDDLNDTVAAKDKEIESEQEACDDAIRNFNKLKEATIALEEHVQKQEVELTEQRTAYRTQSDLLADNLELLKRTEVEASRVADIAQAETRNNHENWVVVLENKNAEISGLNALVEASKATDDQSKHLKHVVSTYQGLRKKNARLEQVNKEMKTDIQNLLAMKQSDSELLTEYLHQAQALRAERTEALDQVTELNQKLEKSTKYVAKLQNIISNAAMAATTGGGSCNGFFVPREVVNSIVGEAIAEYYTEAERLRQSLQEQEIKTRSVQAKFDECDNKLFAERLAEEERLAEVNKLRNRISELRDEAVILKQQLKHRDSLISSTSVIENDLVYDIFDLLRDDIEPLQVQNHALIKEKCDLLKEVECCKTEAQFKVAALERKAQECISWYKGLENLYWNTAVHEHDRLHEELAYWKKRCGKKHFYESRPANLLVHDRRMLQVALTFGREGIEKGMLPKEYFNPNFVRGCHQAVDVALRKLWPDFHQYLHEFAAWVEPTVPLLTGEGEIVMDPATRAASDGRLEEFEAELKALDEQMEEVRNRRLGIGFEDDYSDSEDEERSVSESVATCSESSPPTSKSHSPELEKASEEQLGENDSAVDEDEDGMPAFAKKLRARISAQETENELLAGCVADKDVDEEALLAQHGN